MVKIRLKRIGAKKKPFYRVVVQDIRVSGDGKVLDTVGKYNPCLEPSLVEIDSDKVTKWLSQGAQPSGAVANLLKISGILKETKKDKLRAAQRKKAKSKTKPETKSETKSKTEPKKKASEEKPSKPKTEAKLEPKPKTEAETKPKPKAEAETEAETKPETEAKKEPSE